MDAVQYKVGDQVRQGDVFLTLIAADPEQAKQTLEPRDRVNGKLIIREGEVTGHAHAITQERVGFGLWNGMEVVVVEEPAELVHDEHTAIPLSAGVWEVTQQREYAPDAIRRVVD